jgi:hypothetical protein
MIPGTSRSGATIVGSLLMGADKRSAAEFSFFLAMPTMAGAFAYDLYKNRDIAFGRRPADHRRRLHRRLHHGGDRRALAARLCVAARLFAVRLVAADRWWAGTDRAADLGRMVMPILNHQRNVSSGILSRSRLP